MGLDYVDLYLIHQPYHDCYGAWRAMEELYEAGKMRAIGLDNFPQDRLADFVFFNKVKPAVNLIECNAFYQRKEDLVYMQEQNIQMQAWSPLAAGQNQLFENELLLQLSEKYRKSVPQIILRWLLQQKIIPLVKTTNPERMRENLNIFDFSLLTEDMKAIQRLDTGHSCFPERNTGVAVESFLSAAAQLEKHN